MSGYELISDNYGTSDGNDSFSLQWKNDQYEVLLMCGSDGSVVNYTFTVVEPKE